MKVTAPMSGNVWKVLVEEGHHIQAGDVVVILESMKMEIPIESTTSGVVKTVHVTESSFIQENDLVIEVGGI
ncbi:biotin/lipoyl-containing protein [Bacillus solimangrovi]|uniref:Acetyl-CoA carboxylase biotin carboxyl carrier protein subunit n=1 Tax=Bacillus solimangrovi TaxID=1305675 RepID=A0A1E5LCL9_9BACI|nr:biotin/lipoyl-containing protein [Bacillus solimangrovi]OEH91827.1 acetyl-CoA carboxylase biotin carboxyl carrier protein subunit [Bacillus solimangrovi]